jgi:hypothetical protein
MTNNNVIFEKYVKLNDLWLLIVINEMNKFTIVNIILVPIITTD